MNPNRFFAPAVLATILCAACADVPPDPPAQGDACAGTRAPKKFPARDGERVAVSIHEFRAAVPDVAARGATDLFMTARVQSGQCRVIGRARRNETVAREKQLSGSGLTKGESATTPLTGARYIFEGAITEANASETQRNGGISVAGMEVGGGRNRDVIGIDVRNVDGETGGVVDVVTVRKAIAGDPASVAGIDSLVAAAMARQGKDTTFVPDAQYQQARKGGVDVALRAAIDQAVVALAGCFGK